MRRYLIAILLCTPALLYARGNVKELTVPLKFVPQEGVHASSAALPPGVLDQTVELRVEDARKLPDLLMIGQGTGGDDKPFPIHADRDVRAYIQETLAQINQTWSLKTGAPASRVLTIQITSFAIDESNKALGSTYGADVKLAFRLTDAKGTLLASGVGTGTAHRYGRAHSADNMNEVLSDALKEAYANVLSDQPLQSAWVTGKPAGKAAPAESAEERLRKLDDLLKKGLITKDEYQTKRAEILKDM
jgi:uncharacterized lipoprotein YajG